VLLAALHVALVMLHYFGALTVLALSAGGAWTVARGHPTRARQAMRAFGLAALPALLLLGAWLLAVSRAAGGDEVGENASWIEPPTLHSLPRFASSVIGAFSEPAAAWSLLALLGGAVLWGAWTVAAARPLLACAVIVPVLLALLAGGATGRSLWVPRYLVAVVPPLLLLVALAADRLRTPWRTGAVALLLGWAALAGTHALGERARKPDWPALIAGFTRAGPAQACVNETYVSLPLAYYTVSTGQPLAVRRMSRCLPAGGLTWAVYREETASALRHLTTRGATLGPAFPLLTDLPPLRARLVTWER
jgi:hypothetical protein